MSDFDPYHKWLGIPETARPISKYRLLAIEDFEVDRDVISTAAERQTVFLRTLQAGKHEVLVAQLLNEVSQARVTLLSADEKVAYDQQLRKEQTPQPEAKPAVVPIPVMQTPSPFHNLPSPTLIGNRKPVTRKTPLSMAAIWPIVQPARKPRWKVLQGICKRPEVIGISLVGVIGILVLFISMKFFGDVHSVVNTSPPVANDTPPMQTPERRLEPEPNPPSTKPDDLKTDPNTELILSPAFITNSINMELKIIPAGTFMMGSPTDETAREDDEYRHEVTISKPFYMQTTEVTQLQWQAVMRTEPWKGLDNVKEGAYYAAMYVSWDDAVEYCNRLSARESKTYRLPTEAEWEYACRAQSKARWSFGDDETLFGQYAWYKKNTSPAGEAYAHQVGLKNSNAFGLYDTHGNVWEWCYDYYGEDYYKSSPEKDPTGSAEGSFRVLRGGSWNLNTHSTRSAYRNRYDHDYRSISVGFRLVRELDEN
jgi:formylglycine-generating enzyme required for sulfatase activity